MSHVATVEIEIQNLEDLNLACNRIGLEFREGQDTYRWYGQHMMDYPIPEGFTQADLGKCEHALRVRGNERSYEIGVVKRRDGLPGYALMYDFWCGGHGLESVVGQGCQKLVQSYATVAAQRVLREQGFSVQEHVLPSGKTQLVCRK